MCGISYPLTLKICKVCQGKLDPIKGDPPDPDWGKKVDLLKEQLARPYTEGDRIIDWRMEYLEGVGYDTIAAAALAARTDIDAHQAAHILERGCDQKTALAILL